MVAVPADWCPACVGYKKVAVVGEQQKVSTARQTQCGARGQATLLCVVLGRIGACVYPMYLLSYRELPLLP